MDIRKTTATSILKIGISRFVQQPISLVITAVLARLLSPKDFGLIGIVTIFTSFIAVFSYLGLGSAIIQKRSVNNTQLSTLFWTGLMFGICSTLLLLLLAYPISLFYKEPQLIKLISALSVNFCLSPLYQINKKLLEKNLKFNAIAVIEVFAVVLSGIVGLMAALLKLGVWSLVLQSISMNLISLVFYRIWQKWSPKFIFDLDSSREMIRFGLHMVGAYFASYLERNMDFFLIGKIFGSVTLGFYSLAYRIMFFPVRQISNIFVEVLYPVFSKIQENIKAVERGFLESTKYISSVTFPMMIMVSLLSEKMVFLLFGRRWLMTANILEILAPAGAIYSIWQVSWAVLPALGKPELRMKLGFLQSVFLVLAITIGSLGGFMGAIYGISLSVLIIWLISQISLNKLLNISFSSVFKNIRFGLSVCILMVLAKIFLGLADLSFLRKEIYSFFLEFFIYLAVYVAMLFLFFKKEIAFLLRLFRVKEIFYKPLSIDSEMKIES